jgi:hypothetical protein
MRAEDPEPRAGGTQTGITWLPRWRARAKRFLVGRILAAAKRQRWGAVYALRAEWAERTDARRGRVPPPTPRRRNVRSVVWFAAGPGSRDALLDSIESVVASDGSDTQIVVVDDCSVQAREAVVRERFPQVDFCRTRFPTGGPPSMWRLCQLAFRHAMANYDFELWIKMDSDALATGPSLSSCTAGRIAGVPNAGFAGSLHIRADGVPEDRSYHAAVLAREARRDRVLAAALDRATSAGWVVGDVVQGGVCAVTRAACEAMARERWIEWSKRWHQITSEDLALSLFTRASGLELVSIGDPDGIYAVANKHLPLPKEQIAEGPWVAAHSVRAGTQGEDEATLRSFFRARRADWPAAPTA